MSPHHGPHQVLPVVRGITGVSRNGDQLCSPNGVRRATLRSMARIGTEVACLRTLIEESFELLSVQDGIDTGACAKGATAPVRVGGRLGWPGRRVREASGLGGWRLSDDGSLATAHPLGRLHTPRQRRKVNEVIERLRTTLQTFR